MPDKSPELMTVKTDEAASTANSTAENAAQIDEATAVSSAEPSVPQIESSESNEETAKDPVPAEIADAAKNEVSKIKVDFELHSSCKSVVGHVRDHNEDDWVTLDDKNFAAVADGMGGHQSGEVASKIAVDTLRDAFSTDPKPGFLERLLPFFFKMPTGARRLRLAIEDANSAIWRRSQAEEACRGMGTTVVALWLESEDSPSLHLAHVGDSRIYRFRDGQLEPMTHDHSLLNQYLDHGLLTEEEAKNFQLKNIIVRAVGLLRHVKVETRTVEPLAGDRYLLCSDGLTDLLEDDTIAAILSSCPDRETAVDKLVEGALDAGGYDNITAVLVDIAHKAS